MAEPYNLRTKCLIDTQLLPETETKSSNGCLNLSGGDIKCYASGYCEGYVPQPGRHAMFLAGLNPPIVDTYGVIERGGPLSRSN